jgi:hypothetical protein
MYYETCIAELCDCIYDDLNNIQSICTNCKNREDEENKKPWYLEIKTIRTLLYESESTDDINIRIIVIKKIFEFLLTRPDFLAKNPNFRNCIIRKINEFKNDEKGKDIHELCNNLDIYIKDLSKKDNYVE